METTLYNQKGEKEGKLALPEQLFGVKWKADMVHQVVTAMQSNKRTGTADTKGRGEVRGGGKKPWRQKGTGRARHGSSRSPIWKGGGVTHGPLAEKNYKQKINKKMRALALVMVLSAKMKSGNILFVSGLAPKDAKTKEAGTIIRALSGVKGFEKMAGSYKRQTAVIMPKHTAEISRAFRNLPSVELVPANALNAMNMLEYKYLVVAEPETTFALLEKKFA